MRPSHLLGGISDVTVAFLRQPQAALRLLRRIPSMLRGLDTGDIWPRVETAVANPEPAEGNPLAAYFNAHTSGKGIWKWLHYFEAYHRHFQKFVGREVHVLEIGIYSGGSLEMWREYFGPQLRLYGVDIEPSCKAHENDHTKIFIGDQANREFWKDFKRQVPVLDILIDDGGHTPEQQIVTLEEMLPHLRPGGVYFCEDIQGRFNGFTSFIAGLLNNLNSYNQVASGLSLSEVKELLSPATNLQSQIHSVHCYPFATVIERHQLPLETFRAPKHGSQWGTIS